MDVAENRSEAEISMKEPIKEPIEEPKGKVMDLSEMLRLLETMEVHIETEAQHLGKIRGLRLFKRSETFTTMLQSSTVVDNEVTITLSGCMQVSKNDVEKFDRMLADKNYVKILSSESVFDDFRNPEQTYTEMQMDLSGTALSPGVLTLIDYFQLDGLKERIVELTNKNPTLERILSLDGMQHALPWMGHKAANVVAGRIAQVSLADVGELELEANAVQMSEITDDLDKMRLEYDTLQSVTAILAYMLKTMKSHDHYGPGAALTAKNMTRSERRSKQRGY